MRSPDSLASAQVLVHSKDELELNLLGYLLRQHGYVVRPTRNLQGALEALQSSAIDLAIVDGGGSRPEGEAACRTLRKAEPDLRLMLISDLKDDEAVVAGLETADRYISKPLSPRQFLANVEAMLRRAQATRGYMDDQTALAVGLVTLSLANRNARINETTITVTPREFSLLQALMENANRVLSREQLISIAWGDNYTVVSKTVDVYVQRLRRKLDPHGGPFIVSARGFGYQFSGGDKDVSRAG